MSRPVAALAVLLASPSLAAARPPPVAEFDESPAAPGSADVLHPDLAAAAPQADWVREGYGAGAGVEQDPRGLSRKIRRTGRVTLAGGAIAILGGMLAITGAVLLYGVRPQKRLKDLAEDNGGSLPTDDAERHRLISIARAGPVLAFTGLGVLVGGAVTAAVARVRLKKLRERRRTSIVSLAPTLYGRGAELRWEVRF